MGQDVKGGEKRRGGLRLPVIGLFLAIVGMAVIPAKGGAGTFRFVVQDVEGGAAAWFPREVVIRKSTDLEGGLHFILENPTPRTHVFEAPDLFEQTTEGTDVPALKPLRVYVAPGETVQVQISSERLSRGPEADASGSQNCPFFCPLHGTEDAVRSMIRVVP